VKDLDFDEIDRAVNSVISNGSNNDSNPVSQSINEMPETVQPEPQPVVTAGVPRPPVARRSSGQFMDVVHPSSDMRRSIAIPERRHRQPSRSSQSQQKFSRLNHRLTQSRLCQQLSNQKLCHMKTLTLIS